MLSQRIKYTPPPPPPKKKKNRKYLWYTSIQIIIYVLMKLENIMRAEILNLNFSIKDGVKIVSKTKKKNCLSSIYQGLQCA